jgi:putative RNA 2'-phosphotransferase
VRTTSSGLRSAQTARAFGPIKGIPSRSISGYSRRSRPNLLYHGTVARFLDSIRVSGLERGSRQHVHLSPDVETARKVGQRRGRPVILIVEADRMWRDGYTFYRAENGVWLTDSVPVRYVRFDG